MTRIAALYDVHGNLEALDAVLADARSAGVERYVLGGDYALFGPEPAEVLTRLRAIEEPAVWIRGNTDRWVADPDSAPSTPAGDAARDCAAALGTADATWLGTLPTAHAEDDARFSHASPSSDMESFAPDPVETEAGLLDGHAELLQVFGHTHLQFRRPLAGGRETTLLNPGSVGLPFDGDSRAAYALLEPARGGWQIELRRVGYDVAASLAALEDRFGGAAWTALIDRRLKTAAP